MSKCKTFNHQAVLCIRMQISICINADDSSHKFATNFRVTHSFIQILFMPLPHSGYADQLHPCAYQHAATMTVPPADSQQANSHCSTTLSVYNSVSNCCCKFATQLSLFQSDPDSSTTLFLYNAVSRCCKIGSQSFI